MLSFGSNNKHKLVCNAHPSTELIGGRVGGPFETSSQTGHGVITTGWLIIPQESA